MRRRTSIGRDLSRRGLRPAVAHLFGVSVNALTMDETLAKVDRLVQAGDPVQHCVINASKVVLIAEDAELRAIVATCDLVNADGQAVVWASRLLGDPVPERVAGIDLFLRLLVLAEVRGYSVYFLGARPEVVAEVARRAAARHPALKIAGWHHGYFDDSEEQVLLTQLAQVRPDLLFVGMPSPRKENWLTENLKHSGATFAMGVGGSFDVVAGLTRRAPRWMQRSGLEWAYRFAQEPRRLWRRYLVGNLRFLALVAHARIGR